MHSDKPSGHTFIPFTSIFQDDYNSNALKLFTHALHFILRSLLTRIIMRDRKTLKDYFRLWRKQMENSTVFTNMVKLLVKYQSIYEE